MITVVVMTDPSFQQLFGRYRKLDTQQYEQIPIQKQLQIEHRQLEMQRSVEASKQMVYEGFENTIAILEEFEERENRNKRIMTHIQRSPVNMPDQSKKTDYDIKTILEAQILLLEFQMKTCDATIRNDVSNDLQHKTLQWIASREALNIQQGQTDKFTAQVYDVASQKETQHPEKFYRSPHSIENVTMKHLETTVSEQFRISVMDREYGDNQKKATIPTTRTGDIDLGIRRLERQHEHRLALTDNVGQRLAKSVESNPKVTTRENYKTLEKKGSFGQGNRRYKRNDLKRP